LGQVNARWHATNFAPLVDACVGHNALDATAAAVAARAARAGALGGSAAEQAEARWAAVPAAMFRALPVIVDNCFDEYV
jgi:hypothetical protein